MFGSVYFGQSYFGGNEWVVAGVIRNLFILLDYTLAGTADFATADIDVAYQPGDRAIAFEQADIGVVYQLIMRALELTWRICLILVRSYAVGAFCGMA